MLELIAAILVLYWIECVGFVPGDARAIVYTFGRRLAYKREGLRLLNLWPADLALVATPLPVEVTPTRLYATLSLVPFSTVHEVMGSRSTGLDAATEVEAIGSAVRIAGRPFVRLPSREHAAELAEWLDGLRSLSGAARSAAARERLTASLSLAALEAELARSAQAVRHVGWLACAALLFLLITPALLWLFGRGAALAPLGVVAALLWLATLVLAWRAHRGLHPAARYERFELLLTAALFPPEALRLPALLRRRALARFHPLAFAARFLPAERFRDLAHEELGRLAFPAWRRFDEAGSSEAAERRAFLADARSAVIALAGQLGISAQELLAPRHAIDPGAVAYCPRCLREYTRAGLDCASCGIAVVPCAALIRSGPGAE